MTSVALRQLADLHRSMYERALAEAKDALGSDSATISQYADEFAKSLPNSFKSVPARRISQAIDNHHLILFGDFHSHKQCQRALLRIMRTYQNTPDHAPMILALEMFRNRDQSTLDAWQDGRISDEQLLEATDYEKIWGFPWSHYRPLLEYCRLNSIPLVAANSDHAGKDSLAHRDNVAAQILVKISNDQPSSKIFYIVGEYHLANSQLPAKLELQDSNKKVMRIIANSDKYFFMLENDRMHRADEFLEIADDFYCVLNSPPWIKWQSQTLMEELRRIGSSTYIDSEIAGGDRDDDYDDDEYFTEDSIDVEAYLRSTIDHLGVFLGFKETSKFYDSFKIVTEVDDQDLEHVPAHARAAIFEHSSREGVATDFRRRVLFLSEISANNLAYAAGQIVFGILGGLRENYNDPEDLFVAQILKMTFGHLANKILNPRIILHTRKAIEDYIGATRGKHIGGQSKLRRDVARGAIKFFQWYSDAFEALSNNRPRRKILPPDLLQLDSRSAHDLSRHIAQTLTSVTYQRMIGGRLDVTDVQRLFSKKCETPLKMRRLLNELLQNM
jgi:uncharacterized iron-regulated protein